jgi:hypothetical protein
MAVQGASHLVWSPSYGVALLLWLLPSSPALLELHVVTSSSCGASKNSSFLLILLDCQKRRERRVIEAMLAARQTHLGEARCNIHAALDLVLTAKQL